MMPLLAKLMVIWLSTQKKSGLSDEQTYTYLTRAKGSDGKQKRSHSIGDAFGILTVIPKCIMGTIDSIQKY